MLQLPRALNRNWFLKNKNSLSFLIILFLLLLPSGLVAFKFAARGLYFFLFLAAMINNLKKFTWVVSPFLLLLPVALYFWFSFHAPPNVTFWSIFFGTNVREFYDFMGAYWLPAIILYVLYLPFVWILCKNQALKSNERLFKSNGLRGFCLLLIAIPFTYYRNGDSFDSFYDKMDYHFSGTYPINFGLGYWSALRDIDRLKKMSVDKKDLDVQNLAVPDQKERPGLPVYVLVIGESARRDRHSLYGYAKPTNPLLSKEKIWAFSNAITLHPHTAAAVPVILTKENGISELESKTNFSKLDANAVRFDSRPVVPSFLQVFKQAHFKTFWITNQASGNGAMTRFGVYAHTADFFKTYHVHDLNLPWAFDGELLNDFRQQLQSENARQTENVAPKNKSTDEPGSSQITDNSPIRGLFFVFHLQGSHYGFKRRYPTEFQKFEDDYDNTILYTDWVLSKIIDELKQIKNEAGLLYVSDHGLMLGECDKKYTHFDIKQSFEVPLFLWLNEYRLDQLSMSDKSALHSNLPKKITTEVIFDSLIDLGHLRYRGYDSRLSVFQPDLFEPLRKVQTYSRIVDYDKAHNDTDCHLVPNSN